MLPARSHRVPPPLPAYAPCRQLARRAFRSVHAHMLRFTYSPLGALRWKRDVQEYAACLARAGAGAADARFEELQVCVRARMFFSREGGCCRCTCCLRLPCAAGGPTPPHPPPPPPLSFAQALSNLLVVAPESLLPLVDGNLRLARRDALAYVQLRTDFRTARVEEATLAALFSTNF